VTQIIQSLADLTDRYDVLLCDLWGCVHNGREVYPEAVPALRAFREAGKTVVLLTNSPRDREGVAKQVATFGLPDDCWDTIASSGDAARAAMFMGAVGTKVHVMGEQPGDGFFRPMEILDSPVPIQKVAIDAAEGIVCLGPDDPQSDPESWRADLLYAKQKDMKLLCANPDIVVDRGEEREWCAGAVARLYTEMGGESLYFGKPHPPIYDLARRRLASIDRSAPEARMLAVGDGIQTDIKGALGEDIDSLFITGGLARVETGTVTDPDPDKLAAYIEAEMVTPTYAIGALR
jgi:HAD superfamily hydrolase (TIGR01459 family)